MPKVMRSRKKSRRFTHALDRNGLRWLLHRVRSAGATLVATVIAEGAM